jgi:hypothetical protein
MTNPPNIDAIIAELSEAQKRAIRLLSAKFAPTPQGVSRQAVAVLGCRNADLCEREWQDGCAQCTYYRLTPLGSAVRSALIGEVGRDG